MIIVEFLEEIIQNKYILFTYFHYITKSETKRFLINSHRKYSHNVTFYFLISMFFIILFIMLTVAIFLLLCVSSSLLSFFYRIVKQEARAPDDANRFNGHYNIIRIRLALNEVGDAMDCRKCVCVIYKNPIRLIMCKVYNLLKKEV